MYTKSKLSKYKRKYFQIVFTFENRSTTYIKIGYISNFNIFGVDIFSQIKIYKKGAFIKKDIKYLIDYVVFVTIVYNSF